MENGKKKNTDDDGGGGNCGSNNEILLFSIGVMIDAKVSLERGDVSGYSTGIWLAVWL